MADERDGRTSERGFGDDQGTRVGRPDESGRRARPAREESAGGGSTGPSSQPVEEGLEGSIFEGDDDRQRGGGSTGPGTSR